MYIYINIYIYIYIYIYSLLAIYLFLYIYSHAKHDAVDLITATTRVELASVMLFVLSASVMRWLPFRRQGQWHQSYKQSKYCQTYNEKSKFISQPNLYPHPIYILTQSSSNCGCKARILLGNSLGPNPEMSIQKYLLNSRNIQVYIGIYKYIYIYI